MCECAKSSISCSIKINADIYVAKDVSNEFDWNIKLLWFFSINKLINNEKSRIRKS